MAKAEDLEHAVRTLYSNPTEAGVLTAVAIAQRLDRLRDAQLEANAMLARNLESQAALLARLVELLTQPARIEPVPYVIPPDRKEDRHELYQVVESRPVGNKNN